MEAEKQLPIIHLVEEYIQHDEARQAEQPLPWREFHDEVGKLFGQIR